MPIHRTRLVVAAMAAALLLTSIVSGASANDGRRVRLAAPLLLAGGPGGSTTGVDCAIRVAASGEGFGASATVVPLEGLSVAGQGFAQNGPGELVVEDLDFGGQQTFDVTFDSEGDHFEIGSFEIGSEGSWRMTLRQASPECSAQALVEVLPLNDVSDSKFLRDIKWLFVEGITFGCTDTTFCPNGLVTRGQMATFLSRALHLPATSTDYFTDDETNKHEANINRLREAGITFGCTETTFCPDGVVTRGQMSSFLVRAYDLPITGTDYFTDDETNKHEANINRLREAGITFGCTDTTFCPNGSVTRGQMSAFLHRAVD